MKKEKIRRFRHVGVMIFMIGFVQPVQLQNVFAQEISQTEQEKVDYMVFKDSSDRILNESDIWLLSQSDIRIAKNEIYARHGRKFASKDLQEYFNQLSWYEGTIEPENFDESCITQIERANINFLDQSFQNGVGAENPSVIEQVIEDLFVQNTLTRATFEDKIGMSDFTDSVSVWYREDIASETEQNESQTAILSSFYQKDNEIFGNIGYRKSIYYLNEGSACAWFNGHEYKTILEQSSPLDSWNYLCSDEYGLYQDQERIVSYSQESSHESGGASSGTWLLSEQAIYAGGNNGLSVFDWSGNLIGEYPEYMYAFMAKDGVVYLLGKDFNILRADEKTLGNPSVINDKGYYVYPTQVYGDWLVCVENDRLYGYQMISHDNIKEVFLDENTNWRNFAAGDGCLYEVRNEWHTGRCTVERVTFEDAELANSQGISPQKEIVCIIEGIGYASIEKVEGNLLYFSCGPKDGDWNSPEGNMNDVSFAIDLEKGIVYVLGAGWYS